MNPKIWRVLLGISLVALIMLTLFVLCVWFLLNVGGALLPSLPGNTGFSEIPLSEFLGKYIGSPIFYVMLGDLAVMLLSIGMLIVCRRKKRT